jgi:hypothetical protein
MNESNRQQPLHNSMRFNTRESDTYHNMEQRVSTDSSNAESFIRQGPSEVPETQSDPESNRQSRHSSRNPAILWTPDEDRKLLNALQISQREDWSAIARSLPGRTGKQCWHRYNYHLKQQFRTGDWTAQEDAIILQQQAIVGNRWSQIAHLLPGRSENSIKNRWHCALRYQQHERIQTPATETAIPRRRSRHRTTGPNPSGDPESTAAPTAGSLRRTYRRQAGHFVTPRSPGRHVRHRFLLHRLLGPAGPAAASSFFGASGAAAVDAVGDQLPAGEPSRGQGAQHSPSEHWSSSDQSGPWSSGDGSAERSELSDGDDSDWWDRLLGGLPSAAAEQALLGSGFEPMQADGS